MPQHDPAYIEKVYGIMKAGYGDKFVLKPEEFSKKLESDPTYREKVYGILKQGYGDKFTLTTEDFNSRVSPPGKAAPVGSGAPTGEQKQPLQMSSGDGPPPSKGKGQSITMTGDFAPTDIVEEVTKIPGAEPLKVEQTGKPEKAKAAFSNYEEKQRVYADETKFNLDEPDTWTKYTGKPASGNIQQQRMQKSMAETMHKSLLDAKKRDADLAQKQMQEELKPIVSKAVEGDKYKSFTMRDANDMVDVVNPNRIAEEADRIAEKNGLPTDSYFRRYVYNTLTREVGFKILEPEVNKIFDEKAAPLLEGRNKEIQKATAETEAEKLKYQQAEKALADDLSRQQTAEVDNITLSYQQSVSEANKSISEIEQAYQAGQLPQEVYESAYREYEANFPSYDEYVKNLNIVNSRYNKRFKREQDELLKQANDRISKISVPDDPELQKKLQGLYKQAYGEAFVQRAEKIKTTEQIKTQLSPMGSGYVDHLFTTTAGSFGGAIGGLGSSMGSEWMERMGDYLEQRYTYSPPETKEWADLLDPTNLTALAGTLAGGMALPIAAGATATVATGGGVGGMLAGGLASWAAETADIAGRAKADRFEATGNVAEAELAGKRALDAQVDIMLAYTFDMLPFAGNVLKAIPTKAGRIAAGATTEVATELAQELPQNIAEENISQGIEAWDGLREKITDPKRIKETAISIAPIAVLGGAGQVGSKGRKEVQADLGTYYGAKMTQAKLNDVIEDQGRQAMQNIVFTEGEPVARATVTAMYSSGNITEEQAATMNAQIDEALKLNESANEAKLSPNDRTIYAFYAGRANEAVQKAGETQDPILSKVYEQQAKDYEQAAFDLLMGKDPDFLSIRYKDGSEFLMTPEDAKNALSDPRVQQEVKAGNIEILAFGKEGGRVVKEANKSFTESKPKQDDTQDQQRLPVDEQGRKEGTVEAEPVERGGTETGEAGVVLQEQEEVTVTPEEESAAETEVTEVENRIRTEVADATDQEVELAAAFVQEFDVTPAEAVEFIRTNPELETIEIDEATQSVDITPDGDLRLTDTEGQKAGEGDIVQPAAELAEGQGALKDVESKFPIGTTIKWDVFGNEKMGDWTIAEHTTTRGGKPAIRLTRFIEQGVAKGGGKAGYTQEQIVSVEDLQAEGQGEAKAARDRAKQIMDDIYWNVPGGRHNDILDEGFANAPRALNSTLEVGGDQYAAHGMGKSTVASALKDLFALFDKGIDPNRGGGRLYVDSFATAERGRGAGTGTASGNAYMDGPFTLVARRGEGRDGITDMSQVGGIIVNDGIVNARPEILDVLRAALPGIVIESTSNARSLIEQMNQQAEATQQASEQAETSKKEEKIDKSEASVESVNISEPLTAIDPILEMKSGPEAVAARREYKEKYGKDTYEKAVKITRNFDKIVDKLEKEGKLKKNCP